MTIRTTPEEDPRDISIPCEVDSGIVCRHCAQQGKHNKDGKENPL